MTRLTEKEMTSAIFEFASAKFGADAVVSAMEEDPLDDSVEWEGNEITRFLAGCEIVYRDDLDVGTSFYQVVGPDGAGDGSGEWTQV